MIFTPSVQLLHTDQHVRIRLLSNSYRAALEVTWLGYCSGAILHQLSERAAELAQHYYVTSWIADDRELGALSEADLQWAEQQLEKMHRDLELDRFAMLVSHLPPNQELLQAAVAKYSRAHSPITLCLFTEPDQARAWALSL